MRPQRTRSTKRLLLCAMRIGRGFDISALPDSFAPTILFPTPRSFKMAEASGSTPFPDCSEKPSEHALSLGFKAMPHRDSGVWVSDSEDGSPRSQQSGFHTPSSASPASPISGFSRVRPMPKALRRPHAPSSLTTAIPLNQAASSGSAKPKSELELRHDVIRNSSTQSRAALKSPTALLKARLKVSTKSSRENSEKTFTPPPRLVNGCLMPGPSPAGEDDGQQPQPFKGSNVRARTGLGRPAWWCRFDRLVVFDGVHETASGLRFLTRSSKGLSIARRCGESETVVIPMDCAHCRDMLRRDEWKYDVRVCRRGVCWDCRERCRWESEQEGEAQGASEQGRSTQENEHGSSQEDGLVGTSEDDRLADLRRNMGIEAEAGDGQDGYGGIEQRLHDGNDRYAVPSTAGP